MKKSIKIIIAILIILILMLATKSYAALESKKGASTISANQINAYQLCYDMRDPTSSLGNNNLDPHLSLNKDYGAWAYLGMSAYGTNGGYVVIVDRTYLSATPNETGVILNNCDATYTAGTDNTDKTSEIVKKYGESKYLEVFDQNNGLTVENTRGMALIETKGWYKAPSTTLSYKGNGTRRFGYTGGWNMVGYGYGFNSGDNSKFRPTIWNGR